MEVIACPFLSGRIPISASLSYHPHLPSISSLSLFTFPFCPFFSLIGNLFHLPLYPHLSVWLLSSGPSSVTCIYPSVTIPPSLLFSACSPGKSPISSIPLLSPLCHTLSLRRLSLPPLTLAFSSLQPCRRDEMSVCTIHWSRQTPVPPSFPFSSLSSHTHIHRCTEGDEGKAWSKTLQWII